MAVDEMATSTATADIPPPLQHLPSAKEKKYDRQLRLWGASGQIALEESHILLLNSGAGVTGIETLKNLVLPGVGRFTIADSAVVSEEDLGVNFFLDDASLGKFRAEETVRMLMELNPGVQGHAVTEPFETFLTQDGALNPYNLILVAAPIDADLLSLLQNHAQKLQIPMFYFHSVGFYAAFSVLLPPAFPIVDTHPDPTATTDLRLLKPWPELSAFAAEMTKNMDDMPQHDKGHIPYVCLLLHYLEVWKHHNNNELPKSYKQKTAIRDLVRAGDMNEENFDEAYAATIKSLNPPEPSSTVISILSAPEAQTQNLTPTSPSFWLVANAIHHFYKTHGVLPLPGAVPDMKARSNDYITLQNIYKFKARADTAEVLASVRALEKSTSRSPNLPIDEKDVELFCKGAAHIHLVRGKPIPIPQPTGSAEPYLFDKSTAQSLVSDITNNPMGSLLSLHISFLAWDSFIATHTSSSSQTGGQALLTPGSNPTSLDADTQRLTGIAHKILDSLINQAGTGQVEDPEYSDLRTEIGEVCLEMARAGGGELHNIASLTGGLIAQEVIKVLTRQYVPVAGTAVFDGVRSRSQVFGS